MSDSQSQPRTLFQIVKGWLRSGSIEVASASKIGRVRLNLSDLRQDRDKALRKLGEITYRLIQKGALKSPAFNEQADKIKSIEKMIIIKEAEVEQYMKEKERKLLGAPDVTVSTQPAAPRPQPPKPVASAKPAAVAPKPKPAIPKPVAAKDKTTESVVSKTSAAKGKSTAAAQPAAAKKKPPVAAQKPKTTTKKTGTATVSKAGVKSKAGSSSKARTTATTGGKKNQATAADKKKS